LPHELRELGVAIRAEPGDLRWGPPDISGEMLKRELEECGKRIEILRFSMLLNLITGDRTPQETLLIFFLTD